MGQYGSYRDGTPKRFRCRCEALEPLTCVAERYGVEREYVKNRMEPCPCLCHADRRGKEVDEYPDAFFRINSAGSNEDP